MTTEKQTFCRICEPNCTMLVESNEAGEPTKLKPYPNHPLGGKPCNKGLNFLSVHKDPDRLNWPLKRTNGKNEFPAEFERITWDQALSEIAERLRASQKAYGPNSVATYTGNPLGFDIRALTSVYSFASHLGSSMEFTAGTQDCCNKNIATTAMYGGLSFLVPDLHHTDYLLCLGANPKASHWTLVEVPNDSGEILKNIKRRGGTVTFVNPRKLEISTPETGETVQIKPDTDVYFLAALSHEIERLGGFDEAKLSKYGEHVTQYLSFIRACDPERILPVTGISRSQVTEIAEGMISATSAAVYMATGVNQGRQGVLSCWLVEMLNFATGNLGREGGTYMPNGLTEPMATPIFINEIESVDGMLPKTPFAPPATLLPDWIESGDIRCLISTGGNPVMSCGGGPGLRNAFSQLDLMVAIDILPTVTTESADYVLPATDWLEREDVTAFSANLRTQLIPNIQYTEAIAEPAFERKTDWWIHAKLLQALDVASPLDSETHQDGWELVNLLLSAHGLSKDLVKEAPHQMVFLGDLPKDSVFERALVNPEGRIDCYPRAFVSSGLFERFETVLEELQKEPPDILKLISMRTTHMHNSWLMNVPSLRSGALAEQRLRISPEDAAARELHQGSRVRLYNDFGDLECRIDIRDDLGPGVVAMTHGFGNRDAHRLSIASHAPGVNVNELIAMGPRSYEPLSYMSWMTGIPVRIELINSMGN